MSQDKLLPILRTKSFPPTTNTHLTILVFLKLICGKNLQTVQTTVDGYLEDHTTL